MPKSPRRSSNSSPLVTLTRSPAPSSTRSWYNHPFPFFFCFPALTHPHVPRPLQLERGIKHHAGAQTGQRPVLALHATTAQVVFNLVSNGDGYAEGDLLTSNRERMWFRLCGPDSVLSCLKHLVRVASCRSSAILCGFECVLKCVWFLCCGRAQRTVWS
jgi:hypothetical protein